MFGCFYRGIYVTDVSRGFLALFSHLCDNTQIAASGFPEESVELYDGQVWFNDEYELVFSGDVVPEWLYRLITENGEKVCTLDGTYIMTGNNVSEFAGKQFEGVQFKGTDVIDGTVTNYYCVYVNDGPTHGVYIASRLPDYGNDIWGLWDTQNGWMVKTLIFDNAIVPEWLYRLVTENGVKQ